MIEKSNMKVKQMFIDEKADPSQWTEGFEYKYSLKGKLAANIEADDYILGLAIVDTTNNKPGIQLAIKDLRKLKSGWFEMGTVKVYR